MSGLKMKYFVLKPAGDSPYSAASRKALRAYAKHIEEENENLAVDLYNWAMDESPVNKESTSMPPESDFRPGMAGKKST